MTLEKIVFSAENDASRLYNELDRLPLSQEAGIYFLLGLIDLQNSSLDSARNYFEAIPTLGKDSFLIAYAKLAIDALRDPTKNRVNYTQFLRQAEEDLVARSQQEPTFLHRLGKGKRKRVVREFDAILRVSNEKRKNISELENPQLYFDRLARRHIAEEYLKEGNYSLAYHELTFVDKREKADLDLMILSCLMLGETDAQWYDWAKMHIKESLPLMDAKYGTTLLDSFQECVDGYYQLKFPFLAPSGLTKLALKNLEGRFQDLAKSAVNEYMTDLFKQAYDQYSRGGTVSKDLAYHLKRHRSLDKEFNWAVASRQHTAIHANSSHSLEIVVPHLLQEYRQRYDSLKKLPQASPYDFLETANSLVSLYNWTIRLLRSIDDKPNIHLYEKEVHKLQIAEEKVWNEIRDYIQTNFPIVFPCFSQGTVAGAANTVLYCNAHNSRVLYVKANFESTVLKVQMDQDSLVVETNPASINVAEYFPTDRIREYVLSQYIASLFKKSQSPTQSPKGENTALSGYTVPSDIEIVRNNAIFRIELKKYVTSDKREDKEFIAKLKSIMNLSDEDLNGIDPHIHVILSSRVAFPDTYFEERLKLKPALRSAYDIFEGETETIESKIALLQRAIQPLTFLEGTMPVASLHTVKGGILEDKLKSRLYGDLGVDGLYEAFCSAVIPSTWVMGQVSTNPGVPSCAKRKIGVYNLDYHPRDVFLGYGKLHLIDFEEKGAVPFTMDLANLIEYTQGFSVNRLGWQRAVELRDSILLSAATQYNQHAAQFNETLLNKRATPYQSILGEFDRWKPYFDDITLGDANEFKKENLKKLLHIITYELPKNIGTVEEGIDYIRRRMVEKDIEHLPSEGRPIEAQQKYGLSTYLVNLVAGALSEKSFKPLIDLSSDFIDQTMNELRLAYNNSVIYRAITYYNFFEEKGMPNLNQARSDFLNNAVFALQRIKNEHATHYVTHRDHYEVIERTIGGLLERCQSRN